MTTATISPVPTPTLTERDAFLAAIAAAPADPAPRLIYADWLAEQGDEFAARVQRADAAAIIRAAKEQAARTKSAKLHPLVVALGKRYHAGVEDLYASKRGDVEYGRGGTEHIDWDAYGKRGYTNPHTGRKQPAKWSNGGARLDCELAPKAVILENHRGTTKATLPIPKAPRGRKTATANVGGRGGKGVGKALLRGDLWGWSRTVAGIEIVARYGVVRAPRGAKTSHVYQQAGVAVRLPVPEFCRVQGAAAWGIFSTTGPTYWEHGATVRECRDEYRRKLELATAARDAALTESRIARAAAQIAVRWPQLVVTVEDARSVGYCAAGIAGFAARFGLSGQSEATAAVLRGTADPMVEKVISAAALRVARALFARKAVATA